MPCQCTFSDLAVLVTAPGRPPRSLPAVSLHLCTVQQATSPIAAAGDGAAARAVPQVKVTFEVEAAVELFDPPPPDGSLLCPISALSTSTTKCRATITLGDGVAITIDFSQCRGDFAIWRSVVTSFEDMEFHSTRDASSAKEYFGYYALLSQQQNMLTDFTRTSTYQYACLANAAQFKGKTVCDVGCGTGILSFFSARAGARKVYGVDASNMADHAKALVDSNGMADIITVVKGKVEDIELPEKVDILISEPMGMALLNERMLESYVHARKWLRPGGAMYPSSATLYCCPFTDEQLYQELESRATFWNSDSFFGVNMQALKGHAREESFRQPVIDASPPDNLLGRPAAVEFDFLKMSEEDLHEVTIPVHYEAPIPVTVHGLSFWFDVLFDGTVEKVFLSTSPASPVTHWYQTRCVFSKPLLLSPGEVLICTARFIANAKQSYDIRIERVLSPSNARSVDAYNLKEPYFRLNSGFASTFSGKSTPAQFGAADGAAAAAAAGEPTGMEAVSMERDGHHMR